MIIKLGREIFKVYKTFWRRVRHKGRFIGYIGWVERGNLGDEAMFKAIKLLMPEYKIEIYSGARKEKLLFKLGVSGKIKFKKIILGGGTLISQGYLETVKTALSSGCTMHTFGTGVGSSGFSEKKDLDLRKWRSSLCQFKSLGVRGPYSKKYLEEIGIKNSVVIGDLALALTIKSAYINPHNKKYILNIALPNNEDTEFPSKKLIEEVKNTVCKLKTMGYQPMPVAFCENDVNALKKVFVNLKENTNLVYFPKNYLDYFNLLKTSEFVIGVRLHCAVLACCAGVPPILIGYRNKCIDFMESMGLSSWHCDVFNFQFGDVSKLAKKMILKNSNNFRTSIHNKSLKMKRRLIDYSNDIKR